MKALLPWGSEYRWSNIIMIFRPPLFFLPRSLIMSNFFQTGVSVHVSSVIRRGPGLVAGRHGRQGADVCSPAKTLRRQPDLPRWSRLQLYCKELPSSWEQRYDKTSWRIWITYSLNVFAIQILKFRNSDKTGLVYSGEPKSGHSKYGDIQNLDNLKVGFWMVRFLNSRASPSQDSSVGSILAWYQARARICQWK